MKALIKPVTFLNRNGLKLFGILHLPKSEFRDVGIIILSPGIKSRIAPHRLYVKMAERLCDMGFPVFRFDPEGLGDSEGEIEEQFAADVYGSIQVGRFIVDTIAAIDWTSNECNISKFILCGLCGGAITGLLTAAKDKRIVALIGLGIPVIIDSSNIDASKYITKAQLKGLQEQYVKKIFDFRAWVRFITLKSDYRIIIKSLFRNISEKFLISSKTKPKESMSPGTQLNKQNNNFNPYFPLAIEALTSNEKKLLLIFSESDRLYWEFEEKFINPYRELFEKLKSKCEITIVKKANHIFSFAVWQDEMLAASQTWITKNFGDRQN